MASLLLTNRASSSDAVALSSDRNVTLSPVSGDGALYTPTSIKAGTKGVSLVRKDNAGKICTPPSFHYPKIEQCPTVNCISRKDAAKGKHSRGQSGPYFRAHPFSKLWTNGYYRRLLCLNVIHFERKAKFHGIRQLQYRPEPSAFLLLKI